MTEPDTIGTLRDLISGAAHILITAHLGPDADSICSSLLLADILRTNYPQKRITVSMDEKMPSLAFVGGYESIDFISLGESLLKYRPQLLIILDGNNLPRTTREVGPARDYMDSHGVRTAIIDHHPAVDVDACDVYINRQSPAATQDIFEICFSELKLRRPAGYAQTAMTGLYADTGGFTYENPRYKDTFKMATQLIDDGASTELAANQLSQYTYEGLEVLSELLKNIVQTDDCTYTYISDGFYDKWLADDMPVEAVHEGFDIYMHGFIRNIEGRFWGFAVYPDPLAKQKTYNVSLRSLQGRVDVAAIARKLGGGGHRPAAGAKVRADSIKEVLRAVKEAAGLIK